jgi:hypothetical protein
MARKKSNGNHRGALRLYQSYMFREKDPVIDQLRSLTREKFGKLTNKAFRQIEEEGGPTPGCQKAWYYGKTRRPNNCSVEAAGRAIGKKRVWVNHR